MQIKPTDSCASQTPVLNEVRDITLSVSGKFALVSYEHSVSSTPFPTSDEKS